MLASSLLAHYPLMPGYYPPPSHPLSRYAMSRLFPPTYLGHMALFKIWLFTPPLMNDALLSQIVYCSTHLYKALQFIRLL